MGPNRQDLRPKPRSAVLGLRFTLELDTSHHSDRSRRFGDHHPRPHPAQNSRRTATGAADPRPARWFETTVERALPLSSSPVPSGVSRLKAGGVAGGSAEFELASADAGRRDSKLAIVDLDAYRGVDEKQLYIGMYPPLTPPTPAVAALTARVAAVTSLRVSLHARSDSSGGRTALPGGERGHEVVLPDGWSGPIPPMVWAMRTPSGSML